jgi:hypothetical protein
MEVEMLNRWSCALLLVGAFAGYTIGGQSVEAQQTEPFPFTVGETVTLGFAQHASQPSFGTSIECRVTAIRGVYVKCGPRPLAGGLRDHERWLSMKYVVQVTKHEG